MSKVYTNHPNGHDVIPMEVKSSVTGIVAFALVCLLGAAALGWLMWPSPTPTVKPGASVAVELPSAVTVAPSVEIPGTAQPATPTAPARPAFKALPKTTEVRKRTKLPPALIDQPDTYIMATSTVPAADTDTTVTGVLDSRTGELSLQAVAEPAPWFALESQGAIGVAHGITPKGQATAIYGRHSFMRSKDFHAGAFGFIDTDGQRFIGASLEWRY